jgi:hypothetical protein
MKIGNIKKKFKLLFKSFEAQGPNVVYLLPETGSFMEFRRVT